MNKKAFAAAMALSAVGTLTHCASTPDARSAPQILIAPLEITSAQPPRAGSIPIVVRVRVTNTTQNDVTVDRIDVSSVGVGPYDIASTAVDFHHALHVGHIATFPIWVQASISVPEQIIAGQESAMMMRAVVFLSSASGATKSMVVQRVDTSVSHRD